MELHNHMKFMQIHPVESCMEVHNHMNLQLQKSSDFCSPYKLSTTGSVHRIMIYEMQKMHISLHERKTKTAGT
jgi:hypothetical protein